jgi:ADP-ribose pyrophosphatase
MTPDDSRTVYDGNVFGVTIERWGDVEREIVEHPGAVAVVAVDRDGMVTLVRQLREPARKELVELPAGSLEEGEAPLDCARRELDEETGLAGGDWREVTSFFTTPGFCRERMHLFFAENLERGEPTPDGDEDVELVRWPVAELEQHLGELEDAKTLVGLFLYLREGRVRRP